MLSYTWTNMVRLFRIKRKCVVLFSISVLYVNLGVWDVRKAVESNEGKDELVRYVDQMLEFLAIRIRKSEPFNGYPVTQFIVVFDMTGLIFCISFFTTKIRKSLVLHSDVS